LKLLISNKIKLIAFALSLVLISCVSCQTKIQSPSMGGAIPPDKVVTGRFTADEHKIAVFANGAPEDFWARNDR
jgi:hypothetical protein